MMGKTHLVVGVATAMLLVQPDSTMSYIAAVVGGATGGIMADIDVKIDRSNKYARKASMDALYGEMVAVLLSITLLLVDFFSKSGLVTYMTENWVLVTIGVALFALLTVIGECSKHRDRTHSLLAMILFAGAVALINPLLGLCFGCGYSSHLLIDLLNKSPVRLFYPLKNGVCFKICYADRLGDTLLFAAGVCVVAAYMALQSVVV